MYLCNMFNSLIFENNRATLEYWEIDELIMEPCCALKVNFYIITKHGQLCPKSQKITSNKRRFRYIRS